ncbi:hypothetical protein Btru_038990 [Bulinus truncatus]|nr:hypothetical protein Btru_038990 [Bulinus truncatus]
MVIIDTVFRSVNCTATGHPPPSFTWFRNGVQLDGRYPNIKAYSNGSLNIYNLTESQSGYFHCRASNHLGVSVSVKFKILPEKKPSKNKNDQTIPIVQTVKQGDSLSLHCPNVTETVPKRIERWYYGGQSNQLSMSDRISTDMKGTLRFTNVQHNDTELYSCALVHPQRVDDIQFYGGYKVEVIPNANAETRKPTVMYHTSTVLAHIGNSATLECYFAGLPTPTISWKDNKNNDVSKKSGKFEIGNTGHSLRMKDVTEEDEGMFRCEATNSAGRDKLDIQFNVTSRPMHDSSLDSKICPESKTVTFQCIGKAAKGESLDRPVWYRNGQLLTQANVPDLGRYQFDEQMKSLTIKGIRKSDTACFQCNISNSEGYLFYDGYLRVIDSIKVMVRPPQEIILKPSAADIDVTVKATGDVCCELKYDWFHNGAKMDYQSLISLPTFRDVEGSLMFNRGNLTTEKLNTALGTYTCLVHNDYENVTVSFVLIMPVDDYPDNDYPVDDYPVDDYQVDDHAVDYYPVEYYPVEDHHVEDYSVEDYPIEDYPVEDDYPVFVLLSDVIKHNYLL